MFSLGNDMFLLRNLLTFFFFILASNINAKNFPLPTTPYISDYANLLDPETEARLTKTIIKLRQDLDLELTIATIETRYDYGEFSSIEEFAKGLFRSWGLGDLARNDGVLILISRSDGEMRIEVGSSYGEIYNKRMGLVIQNHFLPYFQGNQIAEGIELGTYEIINRLQPTYDVNDPNQLDKITLSSAIKRTSFWRILEDKYLVIVFLGIILFLNFETRMRDKLIGLRRCPNCRRGQLMKVRTLTKKQTKSKPGRELMKTYCYSCDYNSIEHRSIPIVIN
jgi:uncharacterized protein